VESGMFTARVEAALTISRGTALLQTMATPAANGDEFDVTEEIAASEESTLSAGDVAYIPGSPNGELRNDGQEPAVGHLLVIAPGGTLSPGSAAAAT